MTSPPPDPADASDGPDPDGPPSGGSVFVTGAAGGIGSAVVATLLAAGRRVVATDVDAAGLALLAGVHDGSPLLHAELLDVRDAVAVEALVERVERVHGPIDGLVNGAGLLRAGSALAQGDDEWRAVYDVNVSGVMRVSRAVGRRMAVRHRGALVTIGSNAAAVARDGLSAYASSKAAAKQYTLCLGVELAPLGVRCNVVSPGSTDTPMLGGAWGDAGPQHGDGLDGAVNRRAVAGQPEAFWPGIPLGRIAQPAQIADAVAFLLSPQSTHIALHDLRVDGGATLGS